MQIHITAYEWYEQGWPPIPIPGNIEVKEREATRQPEVVVGHLSSLQEQGQTHAHLLIISFYLFISVSKKHTKNRQILLNSESALNANQ